jgi:LysM repeat protein
MLYLKYRWSPFYHVFGRLAMRGIRFRYGALALVLVSVLLLPGMAEADSGTRYIVRSGDGLGSIARTYGVSISSIMQANGLSNPDFIWAGETLIIPGASGGGGGAAGGTGNSSAGSGGTYVVQLGDTLGDIAASHGVTVAALIRANGIDNPDMLYSGQRLVIPGGATSSSSQIGSSSSASSASSSSSGGSGYYTVKSGDTLGNVAARYSTSAAAIARTNGLTSPDMIYTGMKLRIPGSNSSNTSNARPAPKATGQGTRFVASISQQHCWLYEGSTVVYSWACSTGRAGAPTVPGSYRIQSKIPRAYGSAWNFWMPYWLGIYWAGSTENGIHGFPSDAGTGVKVWTSRIGTPVTYGCILLSDTNAKTLYDMAWIGMPVIITR